MLLRLKTFQVIGLLGLCSFVAAVAFVQQPGSVVALMLAPGALLAFHIALYGGALLVLVGFVLAVKERLRKRV